MFSMCSLFLLLSIESMQLFQEWFSGIKAAAKESSDRTGDSKVLEAKLRDLQVCKLALLFPKLPSSAFRSDLNHLFPQTFFSSHFSSSLTELDFLGQKEIGSMKSKLIKMLEFHSC